MPAVYLTELISMVPEQFDAPVTPKNKKAGINKSSASSAIVSPGGSVSSVDSCDSDDFERSAPGRSKSASAKMQTIREKRFKLKCPMISPRPFPLDVFGECPLSLDVWDEEDKFTAFSQRRRKERSSFEEPKNGRMKGLRYNVSDIDLAA